MPVDHIKQRALSSQTYTVLHGTIAQPVVGMQVSIMSAIRHPNVVLFMGVCLDPPCMVTEVSVSCCCAVSTDYACIVPGMPLIIDSIRSAGCRVLSLLQIVSTLRMTPFVTIKVVALTA